MINKLIQTNHPSFSFKLTGSLTYARREPRVMALKDGRVLVTGGKTPKYINGSWQDIRCDEVEVYDFLTGLWISGRRMMSNNARLSTGIIGLVFNPDTEEFDEVTKMNCRKTTFGITKLPGQYELRTGGTELDSVSWDGEERHKASAHTFITNPALNQSWETGNLVVPRYSHTTVLLPDGNVIVVGGTNGQGCLSILKSVEIGIRTS